MAFAGSAARTALFFLLAALVLSTCRATGSSVKVSRDEAKDVSRGLSASTLSGTRAASVTGTRHLLAEASPSGHHKPMVHTKPPDHILFMYEVHGWLMSLAWGVLAPAAIVLAYNFRNVPPTNMWFHAHRAIMLLAYLMQLAGVGVVIAVMPQYWYRYNRQVMIHISVGIALEIIAGAQVLAAMVKRPGKASRYRRAWSVGHIWIGRLLLIVGIVLIFDGLLLYHSGQPYQHLFIILSAILFFFFAVAAGKDAYEQVRLPPPAVTEAAAAKLQEVALQQRGNKANALDMHDSARVSPSNSADKLAGRPLSRKERTGLVEIDNVELEVEAIKGGAEAAEEPEAALQNFCCS